MTRTLALSLTLAQALALALAFISALTLPCPGDASLKLLLGAYIKKLHMLVELFRASPEDEEQGIWKRPGFKLPQLGALLVASNNEKLVDERTQTELLANSAEYKVGVRVRVRVRVRARVRVRVRVRARVRVRVS